MRRVSQLTWIATIGTLLASFWISHAANNNRRPMSETTQDDQWAEFHMDELEAQRAEEERSYLPFLNRSTLSCGVYFLAAGSTDGQSPHGQDEIYYVRSGKAKLNVNGEDMDAVPGAVLFVAANAEHRFHSIEEDLTLLVFFSKADVEQAP